MPELFSNIYYGNTVLAWLIAMAIIFGVFIVGKIVYWVMGTTVKKLTAKTKTKLDDIIVDMIEEPGDEVNYMGGDELMKYMDAESAKIAALYVDMIKEGAK